MRLTNVGVWFLPLALMGCSESDSANEEQKIILDCTDDSENGTDREGYVRTIKILPDNPVQRSIHHFNWDEKRWYSECESQYPSCQLSVNSRFITEVGTNDITSMVTEINRTTGRISQAFDFQGQARRVSWEGDCVPSEEPQESQTKF